MMKIVSKILKNSLNILVYLMIGVLVLYFCLVAKQKLFQEDELVSIGNYYIFQIASGSMESDLHIGDYIVVQKSYDYQVVDIVTYYDEGLFVTHRIYQMDGNKLITKGDVNNTLDEEFDANMIVGKFLCKAYLLSFLTKYRFLMILFVLLLYIIQTVYDDFIKKD